MLSQPGSSPDQSACSSNTGDVLIRSTQVLGSDQRPEPGPGCVQITVQKLRDPPVQPPLSSGAENQQQRPKSRQKPERAAPLRAAALPQPDRLKKPGPTKENREPRRRVSLVRRSGTHSDQQPGHDLLTSHFAAGGRGVVLAALKQRSHSAPHRREVRVQLLDPGPLQTGYQDVPGPSTSSQDAVGVAGVQMEAGLPAGHPRDATNAAAAAAAAAVAAAAPLIKAQSDMEARVSQLAEGVQQLLQADREGVARGRGLSQQTLHHMETLHSQQLQLQSQLLESALRMVTGHTPVTSDLTASSLQVTHLPDAAVNVLSNQQPGSSATRAPAASVQTGPVAIATPHRDRQPEQIRDDWYHSGAPGVSTATQPAAGSHQRTSANHSQAAARRANEMLREMRRLKTEMKTLLNPENSQRTTRPGPDHHHSQPTHLQSQSQQTESQQTHLQSRSQQTESQQTHLQSQSQQTHLQSRSRQESFQQSQSQRNPSNPNHLQSQSQQTQYQSLQGPFLQSQSHQTESQLSKSQQNHSQSQQTHSQHNQPHQTQSQFSQQPHQTQSQFSQQPHLTQSQFSQQPHQTQSQFSQQPHQTQSQFSQQPHQTQSQFSQQPRRRPVVPSMLEEAGLVLRQVRRRKKVLEENLECLRRAKTGEVLHCQLEALAANRDWTEEVRIKKTVDAWINSSTKDIQAEISSEDAAIEHTAAAVTSQQRAAESSAHGPGRPVSALRGTGSKTAAGSLTTGSKTAAGRGRRGQTAGHRPISNVKAQGAEPEGTASEAYLLRLYGRAPYDGLRRTLKKSPYLRLSSPASPLGRKSRPRLVESVTGVKLKSCKTQTCLAPPFTPSPGQPRPHGVIIRTDVPMAIPLGRPRMDSSSRRLAERQQEVTSSLTAPPTAGAVAVEEVDGASERQSQEQLEAPPPDDIMRIEREAPPPDSTMRNESEAPPPDSIMRNESEEEEDEDVFPGTDFLSVADVAQQEDVSVVELDGGPSPPLVLYQGPVFPPQPRAALPAQDQASFPGHNLQRDVLETRMLEWVEQQLMSRMISEMYRPPPSDPAHNHSVDQSESEERSVTSDIVEAAGGGGLQLFVDSNVSVDSALIRRLVNEVLTEHVALMLGQRDSLEPEPGPGPGPGEHQEEEPVPLVQTPVPTPPPSPAPPSRETPPLTTPPPSEPTSLLNDEPPQPITAPECVATPTSSPEPAHSTGSPPAIPQAPPPLTWGDSELPLDEERPEEDMDTRTQLLVMSVAEEEPPLPSPSPSLPPPPGPEPGPTPKPASPSDSSDSSSSDSSSSSSISTATVATEAALKHISEGELLISVNQLAAITEDGAVCSFSSSLHELQDMDFDPPSEGQYGGHDLLLTKTSRGERPQPEGSWGREEEEQEEEEEEEEESVGEVRDRRTSNPHRTTNPSSTAGRRGQSSSPGQISPCADGSDVSCEATNQGSVAMEPGGTLTSDLDLSLTPPPHTQLHRQTAEQQQGGCQRLEVYLPSVTRRDQDADTSSSTDNIF